MSFKVACPSCEAPVLIKNPNLVGTKVECPKCKYRFKVEEPAADAAAKDKKPEKGAKKAAAPVGKKKKLVPIVIGGVALLILVGVGYAVIGGGKKKPSNPFPPGAKQGGGPDEPPEGKKDDKPGDPLKPSVAPSDKVTTNLLPGQAVAVYGFNMNPLRGSPAYASLIDPQVVAMFQGTLGFAPDDIATYVHCFAGADRDPFGVIKLKTPTKAPDLRAKMPLAPNPKAVKGRELYAFRVAPLLKAVSHALAMRAIFGDLYASLPPASAAPPKEKPFGVCVYDTQHILIGDYALLERFLGELDANGNPPFKSELTTAAPTPEAPTPAPEPAKDPKNPKGPPKTPVAPPAPGEKSYTSIDAYRTLELPLKRALDDLEADRTAPTPLVVYAEKFDSKQYEPKLLKKDLQVLSTALDKVATPLRYLSANVTTFSAQQVVANVRLTYDSASDARDLAKDQIGPGLATVVEILKLRLEAPVDFRDYTAPGTVVPGVGVPGMPPTTPGMPPGPGPGPGPIGMGDPGMIDPATGLPKLPAPTNSHVDLALVDNQLLIAVDITWTETAYRTVIDPRMSGVANQVKGKLAVVSSDNSRHTLAAAGKAAGANGFPRGTTDLLRPAGNRFALPHPPGQRVSHFADLLPYLGHDGLSRRIDRTKPWYALERAKPDEMTPDKLGEVLVDNLSPGGEWVPQLLVAYYPQSAWRATSPYAPDHVFGATNYVAMSGTGLDSARYDPNNAAHKKLVGMTGYGWGSKAEEVTDGLANTIYLIQTPPRGLPQPWIAGGGATVRGFDETDPMAGYKATHPGGKEGTYALMGDGSVRFIPANIDKKVLLAMGTRAGGEALADVNKHTEKIDPPKAAPTTADLKTDPKPDAMWEVAPPPREKK